MSPIPTKLILDQACDFIIDCLHKTAPIQDEGFPLIRTPNIGRGRFNLEGVQRISKETYEVWTSRAIPQKNDLILAREAPAGNVAIIKSDEPYCLGQRTVHLRPNSEIVNPDFLVYFLLAPAQQSLLLKNQVGVHVGHVNMRDIRSLPLIDLPSMEEQNRIAAILSAYDDLIENNNRRIVLLEGSARLLYREWFVRFRFPGHENTRITDGVPEGWERTLVPEIIDINPKEKVEKGKNIWSIPMACLSTSSTVVDTDQAEIKPKASGAKFRNGDVILPRITPCLENGKTALVQFLCDNEVACGSTEYIILRGQRVSPEFTYCLARTYEFRENAIKSMVGSSGRQRVQVSCFRDFLVPLAPRILLDQFDNIAKPNFMMIQTLQTQNQKLKDARDLLLPKLMNGEIPV